MIAAPGRAVRGLIQSADFTTAVAFTLYDQTTQAVVTLGDGDRLILYAIIVDVGADVRVQVFDDLDGGGTVAAGELLFSSLAGTAGDPDDFVYLRGVALTRVPKAKASVASAGGTVIIYGEIQS